MRRKDEPEPDQVERLVRELKGKSPTVPSSFGRAETLSAQCRAELEAISKPLAETGWNRRAAARQLKISYKALLYKIRQYGVRPPA